MIGTVRSVLTNPRALKIFNALFSRGLSTVASFALLYVASKLLETEDYGFYIFMFSLGSAGGLIFSGGMPLLLLKHMRSSLVADSQANHGLLKRIFRWQTIWLSVAAVLCLALALINPNMLEGRPMVALPLFIFLFAFAIGELLQTYFRVEQMVSWALMPRENIWRLLAALCLAYCIWVGYDLSGYEVYWVVSLCLLLCIAVQFGAFIRHHGAGFLKSSTNGSPGPKITLREASFFSANTVFNALAANVETIIIGLVIGLEEAAFFFIALRLTQLLLLPTVAIDTIGVPLVAQKFQDKDTEGAQHLVGMFSLAGFALSVVGALFLIVLGPSILSLFKPEFLTHFEIVIVMTISALIHAWFGPGSNLLMIGDGERYYFWLRCVLLTSAVILHVIFGYLYGLAGIVFTSLVLGFAEHFFVLLWSRKHLQIDMMASSFFKPWVPNRQT